MCEFSKEKQNVNLLPIFEQNTGALQKVIVSVNSDVQGTQFKANGHEVSGSTEIDADGNKILIIRLNYSVDGSNGYYPLNKSINHTFEVSKSELDNAGVDSSTKIMLVPYFNGNPLFKTNADCKIVVNCHWHTDHWNCWVYVVCDGKYTLKDLIQL